MRGYAYDFYCAMDNGGAVTGDLAAVPGFIAALLVVVWVLMKIKLKSCSNLLCCHHYLGRYNSNLGVSVVELLLLWSALNFCKAITVIWGERLADLLRRRIIILVVWVAFVLTFLMLSQVTESSELWLVSFGDWYFSTIPTGLTFGLPALLAIRLRFWVHTSAKYIKKEMRHGMASYINYISNNYLLLA